MAVQCHGESLQGKRVFSCKLQGEELNTLEQTHAEWLTCSDVDIATSKQIVCAPFELSDEVNDVKGMACSDFLYIFNNNRHRHYFACVSGKNRGLVLCYECEADMCFASKAQFDMAVMMIRDNFDLPLNFE